MSDDIELGELDYQIEKRGGFTGLPQLAVLAVILTFALLRLNGVL
jgi:hypothetical protein